MIYERANGGGKIYGQNAEVCPVSVLDRDSFVDGEVDIWQSELIGSHVRDFTQIRASHLTNTSVGCSRLNTEIVQSRLIDSRVRGGIVIGALVLGSKIRGRARIKGDTSRGGVKIIGSTVKGDAVVEGDAIIKGITLKEWMRVSTGVWLREPRYFNLAEPEMADVGITESTDGYAHIACQRRPMADWIKKRKLWIKAGGWTEEMGLRLKHLFEEWLDTKIPTN